MLFRHTQTYHFQLLVHYFTLQCLDTIMVVHACELRYLSSQNPKAFSHTDMAPPAGSPSLESIREGKYLGLTGPQREGREGKGLGLKPPQETIFLSPVLLYEAGSASAKPLTQISTNEGPANHIHVAQHVCWQLWFLCGKAWRVWEAVQSTDREIIIKWRKCSTHICTMYTHSPEGTGKGWQAGVKVKERGIVRRWGQRKLEGKRRRNRRREEEERKVIRGVWRRKSLAGQH